MLKFAPLNAPLVSMSAIRRFTTSPGRMPHKRLVVIGDGPEMHKLRAMATPNVELRTGITVRGLAYEAAANRRLALREYNTVYWR